MVDPVSAIKILGCTKKQNEVHPHSIMMTMKSLLTAIWAKIRALFCNNNSDSYEDGLEKRGW
jgi:hypothetical protein